MSLLMLGMFAFGMWMGVGDWSDLLRGDHAAERGYVFCPAPLFARNPPDRWALPGPHGAKEHCPREGADTAS